MADGVPPGQQYFIINKVRAPDGSQLAVTYQGEGKPLVVEKREGKISQMVSLPCCSILLRSLFGTCSGT